MVPEALVLDTVGEFVTWSASCLASGLALGAVIALLASLVRGGR